MRAQPGGAEAGEGFARHVVPWLFGLAPVLLVAFTWSPSGAWSQAELNVRAFTLPVIGAELFAIAVALREGLIGAMRQWRWPRTVVVAAALLLAIAVATAATAPSRIGAIVLTAYWIIHALFALAMAHLAARVFAPSDLVRALLAGFAVFAIAFFAYLAAIPDWRSFDWKYGFMAFSHIRHAGYYLGAMAALGLGAMAVAGRSGARIAALLLASLAFGMALWTGSRGAALAVVGSLAVGIVLFPALRAARAWGAALAGMAAAVAIVWVAPAAPSNMMGLTRAVQQTTGGDVTTGRTTIWKNVIHAIEKRPAFGYGEGQMSTVAPSWNLAQPHDSILQFALSWGLVGLLCAAVLAAAYLARAIPTARREGGALIPAFMAMTAIAILSLYDASLYYALPQSIFFACAGVIASRWGVEGRSADRSASRRATARGARSSRSATAASASSPP
ncbi:MAG TPA: O-antigen ligase family protein [Sphingomicrobium sp.]|nr:O-antigen ligase family protein [Sphingomicrobium sp.]